MFFPTWWSKLGSFCTSIVGNMLPNCCFQLWTWTTYDHKITETMHMIWFWEFKVFSTENPMVYLTVTLKISLGIKLLNYQKKLWDSFLLRSAPQCWLCFFILFSVTTFLLELIYLTQFNFTITLWLIIAHLDYWKPLEHV